MKPRTSPIWNYFVYINDSSAKCKVCQKVYSRKGRTTSALKSHLKAIHFERFAEFQKLNDAAILALEMKKQMYSTKADAFSDSPLPRPPSEADTSSSDHPVLPPRKVQKRTRDDSENNINNVINHDGSCINNKFWQSQPDQHDIYGQNVAFKLRNMTNEQRIYTEKLINEAMFEGELENLNRHCYIVNPSAINPRSAAEDTSSRSNAVDSRQDTITLQSAYATAARNDLLTCVNVKLEQSTTSESTTGNYFLNDGP